MTIFTIITGVFTIISFFLPFVKNLEKWKSYLYYSAFTTLGLTLGILISQSEVAISNFNSNQVIQILLMVLILGISGFISHKFITKGQDGWGYAIFIVTIGLYLPSNLDKFKPEKQVVEKSDLILLANHYELSQDYGKAEEYLKKYKELTVTELSQKETIIVDKKIEEIRTLQFRNKNFIK